MPTPTITLGRLRLREDLAVAGQTDSAGVRAFTLTGVESRPRLSSAAIEAQHEDLLTMPGQFLPVTFTNKTYLDGFYLVGDTSGTIEDWGDGLVTFRWQVNLSRLGTESDTDIESRLSGAITRVNDFAATGERTHAPATVHSGYWTDATVTTAVVRTGEEGVLRLYRGLGANVSPRWATTPAGYAGGRVRFIDPTNKERAGEGALLDPLGWYVSNTLIRVRPLLAGGVLEVAAYTDGAWHAKAWNVLVDGVGVGIFDRCMLLNNQHEMVTVRLMRSMTFGRFYLDVTLRRGHRFVELYLQHEYGATLKVARATNETGSNTLPGTLVASANDADGNKYIVGSARSFTVDANGGISKAATPTMDAYVGVVAGGTAAVVGDQAADLRAQYLGLPTEVVQGVRR